MCAKISAPGPCETVEYIARKSTAHPTTNIAATISRWFLYNIRESPKFANLSSPLSLISREELQNELTDYLAITHLAWDDKKKQTLPFSFVFGLDPSTAWVRIGKLYLSLHAGCMISKDGYTNVSLSMYSE